MEWYETLIEMNQEARLNRAVFNCAGKLILVFRACRSGDDADHMLSRREKGLLAFFISLLLFFSFLFSSPMFIRLITPRRASLIEFSFYWLT